jgi:hypothetical protein
MEVPKFKVLYESPPISEVVKECTVEVFDHDDLTFCEAAQSVNKVNTILGRPVISDENIISVEPFDGEL